MVKHASVNGFNLMLHAFCSQGYKYKLFPMWYILVKVTKLLSMIETAGFLTNNAIILIKLVYVIQEST